MSSTDLPRASDSAVTGGPKAELAKAIPRRRRVTWWMGLLLAIGFAALVTPALTAERLFGALGTDQIHAGSTAPITVRVPRFAGYDTPSGHIGGGGGVVIARGDLAKPDDEARVRAVAATEPGGPMPFVAYGLLALALAALFAHHLRRSTSGRLLRVQLVNFVLLVLVAAAVKAAMLATAVSVLVVPVALFAMLPTLALDRVVGLATGTLAALVVSLLVPFDVGVVIVLLVQAGTAGLVVAERPKARWRAALVAGSASTAFTAVTYPLLVYLTTWHLPLAELRDPLHSAWVAAAIGPALATVLAVPLLPLYQLAVGEITHGKLVQLEDLSHPLLRQIAEKAPGSWQHSLMMANMAELAANAIGADGRLVRVGAYFHDLGKSLAPKYFIENLDPGETSPHDQLPPKASCEAIFAHVTEGILAARRAGLHERVVDFMHMHHGNGVLEYFWAKCQEQGNPDGFTADDFRYPGVPPQSRETAILAICDAVEAASRTLKKPDAKSIDTLVQRIVYGKLHLGQLDESGLSMGDLRRIVDSLRDTTRHANHSRIEYPWQKAPKDASAAEIEALTQTGPRLDSLDRTPRPDLVRPPAPGAGAVRDSQEAFAETGAMATPKLRVGKSDPAASASSIGIEVTAPAPKLPAAPTAAPTTPITVAAAPPPAPAAPPPAAPAPKPSPEVAQFATEAKETLREVTKDTAAVPRAAAVAPLPPVVAEAPADSPSAVRKRAATIPPLRKPPTIPPPSPRATLAGPLLPKPPARPDPEEAAITQPRMAPAGDDASEANDDTRPRLALPEYPPGATNPGMSLAERIAARIDAQLDDDFGTDTPVSAPTKAELQALLGTAPDPTRVQSLDEIERLKTASDARRSDRNLEVTRRAPHPTAEVDDGDIEAAIELAPPARKSQTIGVAKKKKE